MPYTKLVRGASVHEEVQPQFIKLILHWDFGQDGRLLHHLEHLLCGAGCELIPSKTAGDGANGSRYLLVLPCVVYKKPATKGTWAGLQSACFLFAQASGVLPSNNEATVRLQVARWKERLCKQDKGTCQP